MNGPTIFMYHQVGTFAKPKQHKANYCLKGRFATQMALLSTLGWRTLSMDEVHESLKAKIFPTKSVALTFDDGFANFAEHALPVLARFALKATVFVVVNRIGQKADWLSNGDRPLLMDQCAIRDLVAQGFAIGSHTLTHPRLSALPLAEQKKEIEGSKQKLEDMLGQPVLHFCYPYGDFNEVTVDLVRKAGYQTALTCQRRRASTQDSPWLLPRKAISFGDNAIGFLWKLYVKHH
jgi:peptidoglycan/xylan/chitin deacetylase (PgdA/CDA1 family)